MYYEGVDCVGTANDVFKVVAPPVRWYSVRTAASVLDLAGSSLR